jgi:hypothetical protein
METAQSWAGLNIDNIARPVSLILILMLYSHLRLSRLRVLFPSGFHTKILYVFFNLLIEWYMSCPTHSSWVSISGVIWWRLRFTISRTINLDFALRLEFPSPPNHNV